MAYASWHTTVTDLQGNVIPNASIYVVNETTGITPQLYADRQGLVPLGNPFTAEADGTVNFYVVGGAYRIRASFGSWERTWRYVGIGTAQEYDAEDIVGRSVSYDPQSPTSAEQAQARANIGIGDALDNTVQVVPQSFTPEQQEQARENVGIIDNVPSVSDVRSVPTPALRRGVRIGIPGATYEYDPNNDMLDNGVAILRPTGIDIEDPGRWVMQPGTFLPTFELTFGGAGSGADFTDLEEALRFCSKFRPEYAYGRSGNGRCINLRILAGTVLTQGMALTRGQDLGHVRIVSDDAIVPVNFPTDVWWAYAEYNSRLPLFSTIFDMQGIGYDGVALKHCSSVCFEYLTALPPFAGVINAARHNVFINTDCHGAFRKGRFTGAAGNGIHFEKGSRGSAREADVSENGGAGLYLLGGSYADAHLLKAHDCNHAIRAELGSAAAAFGVNGSRSMSWALYAAGGAKIFANQANLSECYGLGAYALEGSEISVYSATYSLAPDLPGENPNGNFLASAGSSMNCGGIDCTGITASIANFRCMGGSTMNCSGATGTTSIPPNVPQFHGVIFK